MTKVSQRQRNILICLCLAIATAVVYSPVRHAQFINYDDNQYVTDNPHVKAGLTPQSLAWAFTASYAGNWHPLTWISHMLDCQCFGLDSPAHHLVNVAFHIANTLLLFVVLNQMTAAPWRSAFVAALFALHPVHVESVAWVAERKDVLSAFFWILTMWTYVKYVEQLTPVRGSRQVARRPPATVQRPTVPASRSPLSVYALMLLLFALGLMAKPMVVTLPLVLLLLDYWPLGRTPWTQSAGAPGNKTFSRRLLTEKLPLFLLAAVVCVVTYRVQRQGGAVLPLGDYPIGERVSNTVVSYVRYLGKILWPTGLAVFYPRRIWPGTTVAGAAAVLVAVSGWTIWRARREPQFLMGWLWYLGTLVPVIGLVKVGLQSMADRYMYLPSIGLFIMVAWAVPSSAMERRASRIVATVAAAVGLLACAVLSWTQVQYWRTSEILFHHALRVTTGNFVAYGNLGSDLADQGKLAEAIAEYRAAVQIRPDDAELRDNLGIALAKQGRIEEAVAEYTAALRIDPNCAEAHNSMGLALAAQGRLAEAIAEYQAASRIDPDLAEPHSNLGTAFAQQGNVDEAAAEYAQALQINPYYAEAHFNLANLLVGQGRIPEAEMEYKAALRINPDYAEAHNNLGNLLSSQGQLEDAIAEYRASLRVKPDNAEAHCNLGVALANAGAMAEAIPEYLAALRIRPDFVEARYNLGNALANQGRMTEALEQYQEASRLKPDWPLPLRKRAWYLATLEPAQGGDPSRAVALAERACELTGNQVAMYLDTLAAAYAATGRFTDAIAAGQKAIDLARSAGQTQMIDEMEARLQLYRDGHPYRQRIHGPNSREP